MIEYWSINNIKEIILPSTKLRVGDRYYKKDDYDDREIYVEIIKNRQGFITWESLMIYRNGKRETFNGTANKDWVIDQLKKNCYSKL